MVRRNLDRESLRNAVGSSSSFTEAGKRLGCDGRTIRKYCDEYGIDYSKLAIKIKQKKRRDDLSTFLATWSAEDFQHIADNSFSLKEAGKLIGCQSGTARKHFARNGVDTSHFEKYAGKNRGLIRKFSVEHIQNTIIQSSSWDEAGKKLSYCPHELKQYCLSNGFSVPNGRMRRTRFDFSKVDIESFKRGMKSCTSWRELARKITGLPGSGASIKKYCEKLGLDTSIMGTKKPSKKHLFYRGVSVLKYKDIRKCAEYRGIEFDVTLSYLSKIYEDQGRKCYYSDLPILFTEKGCGPMQTASLDRINSDLGYVKGNVRWVYKEINVMKMDLAHEDFLNYCSLITKKFSSERPQ